MFAKTSSQKPLRDTPLRKDLFAKTSSPKYLFAKTVSPKPLRQTPWDRNLGLPDGYVMGLIAGERITFSGAVDRAAVDRAVDLVASSIFWGPRAKVPGAGTQ